MSELLTTDEAAVYLRLSERKLYELVANGEIPCTKVTGRWLFPRAALDRWVMSGMIAPTGATHAEPPPIVGGSHDPLLEWALRESRCGLANLSEGSEEGLQRLIRGEVIAAGIHMHRLDGDDEYANTEIIAQTQGLHDTVVIAFARRQQGLLVAPENPLQIKDIGSLAKSGARVAQRPQGAGAQLLLVALLARANLAREDLNLIKHRSQPDWTSQMQFAPGVRIVGSQHARSRAPQVSISCRSFGSGLIWCSVSATTSVMARNRCSNSCTVQHSANAQESLADTMWNSPVK